MRPISTAGGIVELTFDREPLARRGVADAGRTRQLWRDQLRFGLRLEDMLRRHGRGVRRDHLDVDRHAAGSSEGDIGFGLAGRAELDAAERQLARPQLGNVGQARDDAVGSFWPTVGHRHDDMCLVVGDRLTGHADGHHGVLAGRGFTVVMPRGLADRGQQVAQLVVQQVDPVADLGLSIAGLQEPVAAQGGLAQLRHHVALDLAPVDVDVQDIVDQDAGILLAPRRA
jgi:hypothetical protein